MRTVIISPLDHFYTACCQHNSNTTARPASPSPPPPTPTPPPPSSWGCGIANVVPQLPAGFESEVIVYAGVEGVTQTMVDWGRLMQQAKNISTAKRVHPDIATTSLSIFTDNGAFYNAPVTTLPSIHRPQPRSTAVPWGTHTRCTFIGVLGSQHSCLLFSSDVYFIMVCFFILLFILLFI